MRFWKIGLALVFIDFVALTGWALMTGGGLAALVELHTANPWAVQIFCDLVLALSMLCVFLWRDARAHGRNPVPWVVATLFTGSLAPMLYFLVRPSEGEATEAGGSVARASA